MVVVGIARLAGVVVGGYGGADLLLEARKGDPVDADVAVHPDVTLYSFLVPLQNKIRHTLMWAEVTCVRDL